jgi:hypothetical protein
MAMVYATALPRYSCTAMQAAHAFAVCTSMQQQAASAHIIMQASQRTRPHSRSDPPIRRDEALALGRSDACCEATRHIFLDGSLLPSWCVYERIVLRNCVRRLKWFPLTVFSY